MQLIEPVVKPNRVRIGNSNPNDGRKASSQVPRFSHAGFGYRFELEPLHWRRGAEKVTAD